MEWHELKKEEVIRKLNSDEEGISSREATKRLEEYGQNVISETHKISAIRIFLKQLNSFIIYILFATIVISIIIQHYIDASVILVIVILNATVGFIQQYKAEQSIQKLRQIFIPQAKVFRDKKLTTLSSKEIVPGDIIEFAEGDKVLADCRILESESLETNEAILTGESNPVEKLDTIIKHDGLISERVNMLFAGTTIVKGNVRAIIISTGMHTEFGKIAEKLQEITLPETPMQKKLDKFAKQVSIGVILLAIIIFALGVFLGKGTIDMLLTSIALIISAIPEGLPAIITVTLALATKKMLGHNILIRRLPAAETLGSVTVICSDKTGTMTEEKMHVTDIFCNNKFYRNLTTGIFLGNKIATLKEERELFEVIKTSILSSNARFEEEDDGKYQVIGDTTEQAFVSLALDVGIDKKIFTEIEPRIKEISFSSERKMMSILREGFRRNILYSKGACSIILDKSSFELRNDGLVRLTEKRKQELTRIAESFEKKGLRALAFGFKYPTTDKNLEEGLTFVGIMGLMDPPRKEIHKAISEAIGAGIKVKMITGDSVLTAKTVAERIGIIGDVLSGKELNEMSDEELLLKIEKIGIFARIEPKQKLRIVEILLKKGEQVAITGDGVNDILALKKADIGVAMGKRGSDIARDVSDMILLDDNFFSIVHGIREGRVVYDNSKKAVKFLLASNFGEIFLVVSSILLNFPIPLLPLQILWINLITDSIPALALTKEPEEDDVMSTKPRKESSLLSGILPSIILASVLALISCLVIFYYGLSHYDLDYARTLVLLSLVGFETLFVMSCRSEKPLHKIGYFTNKSLLVAIALVIVLQALLMITPLASVFSLEMISLFDLFLVILASLPGVVVFELIKIFKNRH